jgi:poly-gamma-glutamate synthesis protein (capsule biosynthesis protein)
MMGGTASHKLKSEGPDSFFVHTAPLLQKADLAMGNLEGPLGLQGENTVKKKYTFLIDPIAAVGLAHAGFKLLTLANNHTMDFGPQALQSTLEALDKNGLKHTGAGMNETQARMPAWFDINGRKVAVLAYSLTEPTEFWANDSKPGCAHANPEAMREDIQKARAAGAQLVFVCCHWGREKQTKLRNYQPYIAHAAIDAGADAVVGHHPHIWQQLEVYHGKPIAYSIGNFAFGSLTQLSASGILYLSFDAKNQWAGGKIAPLDVNNYRVHFASRPMTPKNAKKFFDYLEEASTGVNLSYGDEEFEWNVSSAK